MKPYKTPDVDRSKTPQLETKKRKIIHLSSEHPLSEYGDRNRISLQQCRKILCAENLNYTDDEVTEIREILYVLASIADANIKLNSIIVPFTRNDTSENEKSYNLRTG